MEFFAARGALDIESVGGIVADKVVERGLVREPLDLFELKVDQLAKLNLGTDDAPRVFGEKNASKAIQAIERARTFPLSRWLYALAIPDVGKTTASRSCAFPRNDRRGRRIPKLFATSSPITKARATSRKSANEDLPRSILIKSGFAEPSKSKAGQSDGGSLPKSARSSRKAFSISSHPSAGKKVLQRMKQLGIQPKGEKISAKEHGRPAVGGKNLCPHRHVAIHDPRRSQRQKSKRSAVT